MAKEPYFQFYYSDWLGSTRRAMMTPAQRGAYIDLLCHQWADDTCSLPDDDGLLAALSGLGEGWLQNGYKLLRACFPPHPELEGRIANPRLLELRAERDEWVEKSRLGGQKSAEKRWGGKQAVTKVVTKGVTKGQPNGNTPSSSSSPPPSPEPKPPSTPTPEKKSTRFVPPSVEDVATYCTKRGNGIDPQHFIDHYAASGWILGSGQKMKDWKASVRTWEKNEKRFGPKDAADPRGTQAAMDKYVEGKDEPK